MAPAPQAASPTTRPPTGVSSSCCGVLTRPGCGRCGRLHRALKPTPQGRLHPPRGWAADAARGIRRLSRLSDRRVGKSDPIDANLAPLQVLRCPWIVGGSQLANGRDRKLVTGSDDHSRFVVIVAVVDVANGRALCEAFTGAMKNLNTDITPARGSRCLRRCAAPLPNNRQRAA